MKKIVLVVDDDITDIMAIQRALRDMVETNEIVFETFSDGDEILARLNEEFSEKKHTEIPVPYMMFLDLNMPRMDGRETLQAIKEIPKLASIPIIILTTSQNEEDIVRSYDLNANCFITKPVDFDQFIYMVHSIKEFWLTVVSLPHVKED